MVGPLEERLAGLVNAPPRVCVLTESFHPIVGGGETHARLLCGELNRRGAQTMVVTRRTTRRLGRFEQLGGTRVYRVPPAGFKRLGKYGMLLPALFAILRRRAEFGVIYVVGLLSGMAGSRSLVVASAPRRQDEQPQEQPNILLAIADNWSWPHASAYGDEAVSTPTFDRVASEGVLFDDAYVAVPSCTPSRAAILTGDPYRPSR